jgi:tRNA (cmo5U34)-methyltransferase
MRQKSREIKTFSMNGKDARDELFKGGRNSGEPFVFDERVVRVFPDMITRSVPGYELLVPMLGVLARRHARRGTRVYDLGCSLGAATLAMRSAVDHDGVHFIAVDNSEAMVRACRNRVIDAGPGAPVEVRLADVRDVEIGNASIVVLNFTLQFVAPSLRGALLKRIAAGLCPGGILLLSEKIRFEEKQEQALQTEWHHDFKRAKGYSELEIAAKRAALERVLQPDTETRHLERLAGAGFTRVVRWFQCFNFASYIAFR